MAGLCTFHANCLPSSESEDVNLLPCPISQREDKPTAPGRARGSKHTVEGDGCIEEGNIGTLDITRNLQGERGGNKYCRQVQNTQTVKTLHDVVEIALPTVTEAGVSSHT